MSYETIHYYAVFGWIITTGVFAVLLFITGHIGILLMRRIRRLYHITVIGYWLGRLEKEGTHCFQKPDQSGVPNDNS